MMVISKKIYILRLMVILAVLWGMFVLGGAAVRSENVPVQNLEFINVELRQVFRSLAATGRFNVILDQNVKGNVSIAFKSGITAQEAVLVIAKNYGYQYQWLPDSKTIFIGNLKSLSGGSPEKTLVEMPLKYIDAAVAASSLEIVIPKDRIKLDTSGRKLVIFGNSLELENTKEIITKIDRVQARVNVEITVMEVNDDFWKFLGMDKKVVRSHIGIYPVSENQAHGLSSQNLMQSLARRDLTLFDNQEGKLFLGDTIKIQKPLDKNKPQTGSNSTAVEPVDMGTTMKVTFWTGEGNILTIQIGETTLTGAETLSSPAKNESNLPPSVSLREVTSIISLEAGQTFIVTGIINREEFIRLKKLSGLQEKHNFPVLSELFTTENSWPVPQKNNAQVIAVIRPKFVADDGQPVDGVSQSNNGQNPGNDSDTSDFEPQNPDQNGKPGHDGNKLSTVQDTADISAKPDYSNLLNDSVVMVEYLVKSSDTLTGISAKFKIELKSITAANHWDNQHGIIKAGDRIWLPVPKDRMYEIKTKETLWRIAKRYGVTMELLQDLNDITDITKVKAGQKIVLPVAVSQIKNSQF
jgi:LysM repeat protein/Flp pilus assembly secretin CpaC